MSNPTQTRPRWDNGYPTTVEEHVPEHEWHRILTHHLIDSLAYYYRSAERVCVSGQIDIFYEKGVYARMVRPDVFVAWGAEKRYRMDYRVWEEGASPELVIEVMSGDTDRKTCGSLESYEKGLRARECFLFNFDCEQQNQRLKGYRLVEGAYQPIEPIAGRLPSVTTGLHLEASGAELRLWCPVSARWVPTAPEREAYERAGRLAAEERIRELEALLARRGEPAS